MLYEKRKRYRVSGARLFLVWLAILVLVFVPRIVKEPVEKTECVLVEVIDGDTLSVRYKKELIKVRLIGVDAPESVHWDEGRNNEFGILADAYMRELVSGISVVYLEFDKEQYDTYGRVLAYVYPDEEAEFEETLNYRLVADGYAINKEYPPNVEHARELKEACRLGKEQKKGLWGCAEINEIWSDVN